LKTELKSISFRFSWVTKHDWSTGKLREVGLVNKQQLTLGKGRFSQSSLIDARLKEELLVLTIEKPEKLFAEVVAIKVHDKKTSAVKRFIDYDLSRRNVKKELERLSHETGEILVRTLECLRCQAAILVEGPATPQFYCRYCDTIHTEFDSDEIQKVELDYRLCDRCQMYSRPQTFTSFYFYFLIYFGGIHHQRVYCCPGCFRKTAWMMLAGNLPFGLGIPVALRQLHRCYYGAIRKGPFQGLHEANRLLRRGQTQPALDKYEMILERHPLSAGVKYNIAVGLTEGGDASHAIQMLELALEDCRNYLPAQERLIEALFKSGKPTQAIEMSKQFRLEDTTLDELMMVHSERPDTENLDAENLDAENLGAENLGAENPFGENPFRENPTTEEK